MTDIQETDVLIIGGGINGCGTFRDLSAQGIDCLLLERADFCSGASSGSSRLIHGGLKYLETGEFRLVRESAEERNRLLHNAPHYVSALPSIIPLRSRFGGIIPSAARFLRLNAKLTDRGTLITRLGLALYDLYGRNFRAMPAHRMLKRTALDFLITGMDKGIIGAGLYYEGQMTHSERLGLELVLDGEALNPNSRALNHAVLEGMADGTVTYSTSKGRSQIRPRVIINAAGAWIDQANAQIGVNSHLMGGSKGAHLVVDNPALLSALNGHMVYFGSGDGRVNLLYPFEGRVLIGSTDIPVSDPDDAICDENETAYLCAVVSEVFPDIPVTQNQIRFRFSGVRPLPRSDAAIGAVTRDHSIATFTASGGLPVFCLIGGKWTTFRKFSEEATDKALAHLARPRQISTEDMAIGGGKDFPRNIAERTKWITECGATNGLSEPRVEMLLTRYGTRASEIANNLRNETPLISLPDYSCEELEWITRNERVQSLGDLVRNRTLIALSGNLTRTVAAEIAALLAAWLDWSSERTTAEISKVI